MHLPGEISTGLETSRDSVRAWVDARSLVGLRNTPNTLISSLRGEVGELQTSLTTLSSSDTDNPLELAPVLEEFADLIILTLQLPIDLNLVVKHADEIAETGFPLGIQT